MRASISCRSPLCPSYSEPAARCLQVPSLVRTAADEQLSGGPAGWRAIETARLVGGCACIVMGAKPDKEIDVVVPFLKCSSSALSLARCDRPKEIENTTGHISLPSLPSLSRDLTNYFGHHPKKKKVLSLFPSLCWGYLSPLVIYDRSPDSIGPIFLVFFFCYWKQPRRLPRSLYQTFIFFLFVFFFLFFCLFRCFCFASPSSSGWRRPSPLDGPDEIIQPKGSSSNSCLRGKNAPSSPPLVHFHRYKRQTHARQQPIDLQQKNIKRKRIPFLYIQGGWKKVWVLYLWRFDCLSFLRKKNDIRQFLFETEN